MGFLFGLGLKLLKDLIDFANPHQALLFTDQKCITQGDDKYSVCFNILENWYEAWT